MTADGLPMPTDLAADIAARTDSYFSRTRRVVARFGDKRVTYAVFLRRPVISAPRLMVDWLETVAAARGAGFEIEVMYPEGAWVGAGEPIAYITGSLVQLSELETILLQKLGPASVAAHNAYQMCLALPRGDVPGDGGAALRRGRDAGDDGLCRRGRQRGGEARGRQRLHRQCQRRHRALVRPGRTAWAPCRIR